MKKLVASLMLASAMAAGVGVANAQTSAPTTTPASSSAKTTTGGFAAHAPAIANALGMTVADLNAAVASGKTVAVLAKEKGVDLNKIIATWVAEEQAEHPEMAAADVTKRVTDQANGVAPVGGGKGGRHGHKHDSTEATTTVAK
jgi:pyruvate/2-oxoglutarate dehydrogenase complex dihydrolipoamide acyltransferase (E2) component